MYVSVGDVRLFVDIEGLEWVPAGSSMRRRPTVVLLHGGPGMDSSMTKASFGFLSEIAQVVYYDHRGNGRSQPGDPAKWTLDQWGDDVYELCRALGIERPIVIGGSFGGFVAMSYAIRHPQHPAAVGFLVTAVRYPSEEVVVEAFRRLGGDEVADIVQRDLKDSTPETSDLFVQRALPLMSQSPDALTTMAELAARCIPNQELELHFNNGELKTFNYLEALKAVRCPTLVMAGELDPVIPVAAFEEVRDALPEELVEAHLIEGAGHTLGLDAPEQFQALIRSFVERHGGRD